MALIATVVEGQPLLLIHHEGEGDLTQITAPLLVSATLWEAGPAVEGMNDGIVVGGVIDQKPLSQGEARANPRQQRLLEGGKVGLLKDVHMIPEALAAQLLGSRGHYTGQHCALVPLGEGPLAFGPGC